MQTRTPVICHKNKVQKDYERGRLKSIWGGLLFLLGIESSVSEVGKVWVKLIRTAAGATCKPGLGGLLPDILG